MVIGRGGGGVSYSMGAAAGCGVLGIWGTAVCLLWMVPCCALGNYWEDKFCFVFFLRNFF